MVSISLTNDNCVNEKILRIDSPCSLSPGVRGPPVENCASAPFAAAAPEDGPLLAAQHGGAHAAHVHVRPVSPLDGLHLVHHRQDGDGGQRIQLGYR